MNRGALCRFRGCRDADSILSRIRYRGLGKLISMSLSGSIKDSRDYVTLTVNMLHNFSQSRCPTFTFFKKKNHLYIFLFSTVIFMTYANKVIEF